jgi:hypothetical protein
MAKYRIIEEGKCFYPQKKSFLFWSYMPNIDFWGYQYYNLYNPKLEAICSSYAEALSIIEKGQYRESKKEKIIHNL